LYIKQILAIKYHPDKNAGDKEVEKIFQQLQEAKEILCNPEKRQMYDKWRNSGLQISYRNWIGMKEHVVSAFEKIIYLLIHVRTLKQIFLNFKF
jgi:DnaJ-class molecular chaperone